MYRDTSSVDCAPQFVGYRSNCIFKRKFVIVVTWCVISTSDKL